MIRSGEVDEAELVAGEPPWIGEVARAEQWGEREWRQWHTLARRFFADLRVAVERTELGPFANATGKDWLPFTSEVGRDEERPWLEALHRLCNRVADIRREQGWDV